MTSYTVPFFFKYNYITFVGDGALLHKDLLLGNIYPEPEIHARNINICAYNKFKCGIYKNADTITPMYLRKSQAEREYDKKMELSNNED